MNGYNFTDGVRRALQRAREEAVILSHAQVTPEHILLAVIKSSDHAIDAMLTPEVGSREILARKFAATLTPGTAGPEPPRPDLPYTSKAEKVFKAAMSTAADMDHAYVGTEHLLVALALIPSPSAEFLTQRGLDGQTLRSRFESMENPSYVRRPGVARQLDAHPRSSTANLALVVALIVLVIAVLALVRSCRLQ